MKMFPLKNKFFFFLVVYAMPAMKISAQQGHPTVEKISVEYSPSMQASLPSEDHRPDIKVLPHVTITLKTTDNISKVYLKIIKSDTTIIYDKNYSIASGSVQENGVIVFDRQDTVLQFFSLDEISLMLYKFQVYTEDSEGKLSDVFSENQ